MSIFLYFLGISCGVAGVLIVMGAWKESEADYEQVTGVLAKPLELSYEEHHEYGKAPVVLSKIYLEGEQKEYRLRGKLYRLNPAGMESIEVGEPLVLMVKKTSMVGGFPLKSYMKIAPVSGIARPNGEIIISLGKGIAQAKQRLLIGFGMLTMGLILGTWTYMKVK